MWGRRGSVVVVFPDHVCEIELKNNESVEAALQQILGHGHDQPHRYDDRWVV